ncbi:ribonucleoside-diphosphate reductase subunit alpha [uncultured Clostridium sp.]|uniref:ribonucleoside-diphosphate reductase subunit alpha n=1 Tax=uncultured Clostridium sp. TaxID=59620 RepID=UPI002607A772|nr:ribonucleoside-diphosphate reductase subunit alpha [uncultured Clostridium sp.]
MINRACSLAMGYIKEGNSKYSIEKLNKALENIIIPTMDEREIQDSIMQISLELTTQFEPNWQDIASHIYVLNLRDDVAKNRDIKSEDVYKDFYGLIEELTSKKLYGEYILENYSKKDIEELEMAMKPERDFLFTFSGIKLLAERYLIENFDRTKTELPQQMFMGIAMHLAIPEKKEDRLYWVKRFYNSLSQLKATMATPTMSNARKPFYQLSSCFIDTVDDSLNGIYKTVDNFAKVSKFGGGMGIYIGKVRALGSSIRGFKGASGGIIPWVKLMNDTAIAVDQLGVRNGSVAIWLDAWHKDVAEFLQIRTNNGDDRKKAHDVFPGICYPDLFWKLAEKDMSSKWYMMCPHEIKKHMGYSLEDFYGEEWEKRYYECVENEAIDMRVMEVRDIVRLIIKSAAETGTPFAFFRDTVNKMNPNKHKGMVYSSNLCTEIMQNMSASEVMQTEIIDEAGDKIIVEKTKAGDFVVCNLSSIVLGNVDVNSEAELEDIVETQIRAMDNVIDLNYYSVPYAEVTNKKYRAIGLGTSGYHHMLTNNKVVWDSKKHFTFVDKVYENINYYAIKASVKIAKEKGRYSLFEGSDWDNGDYFKLRGYETDRWINMKNDVSEFGMRNGYLFAVAPNGSTATIAGTTEGIDPVMAKFWLEEKKGSIIPKTAPGLTEDNGFYYMSAYDMDQEWSVEAAAVRQRHIDQAQSFNLYITTDLTMRQIANLYIQACNQGVKSIYYVRSKSLEIEECAMCSA